MSVWIGVAPLSAAAQTVTPTPSPTPAPLVLTLTDAIRLGLEHSPGLDAAAYERQVVESKLAQAKRAYILPEIKLRAFGGPVPDVPQGSGPEGNFPPVNTDLSDLGAFFQTRIEAVQPIFTFGKLSGLKEAAAKGVDAKKAQEKVARLELTRKIKDVYFGLTYLYSLGDFLEELRDRAGKARERVEKQIKKRSPDVTEIDRMRLDVFSYETESRLIELQNGIKLGLDTLSVLAGMPVGSPVDIADKVIRFRSVEIRSAEDYLAKAQSTRPEIRQLDDAVAVRRGLLKSTRADFFPSFFLGGFYGYAVAPGRQHVDNPFLKDDFNFNSGGVAFGLEQKLSFHMTDAKYDEALAEYHQAEAQRRFALQGIELQIRKARSEAVSKHDAVKNAEAAFKAGRSWVLATTLNFGVGLVPVKDLLEAFVAYSHVKAGYLDVIHDYISALTELSRVVGEEVADLVY